MLANVENQLVTRSGGLSLFWWAVYFGGLSLYILVGHLYSGGLSLFCWSVFILMACLYTAELSTEN